MTFSKLVFLGSLNYFLPEEKRSKTILYPITRRASIKDVIESLGPPHTEIKEILLKNSLKDERINFDYILKGNEELWIYPLTPPVDVKKADYLGRKPLLDVKFVVDVNVGKLAKLLRMLGFDTVYDWRKGDDFIADVAYKEERIVLTKDVGLLKRKKILWGKFIRAIKPEEQLKEVLEFFDLHPPFKVLSRCLNCNLELIPIEKEKILSRLEPKTKKYFNEFYIQNRVFPVGKCRLLSGRIY